VRVRVEKADAPMFETLLRLGPDAMPRAVYRGRVRIVLATADGHGAGEIMRRADTSKPTVWRWHESRPNATHRARSVMAEAVGDIWRDIEAGHIRAVSTGYHVHRFGISKPEGTRELWRAVALLLQTLQGFR